MIVKVLRLSPNASIPRYLHEGDAGMDLSAAEDIDIAPGEAQLVRTGIAVELPPGTEAQIRPRSGLALKHSITVLNSPGTIDQEYRGEIGVILINHGKSAFHVEVGARIAQLVIKPVYIVEVVETTSLSKTARGVGGFGSTGTATEET
jgi:dUTP pyrophosphatase